MRKNIHPHIDTKMDDGWPQHFGPALPLADISLPCLYARRGPERGWEVLSAVLYYGTCVSSLCRWHPNTG